VRYELDAAGSECGPALRCHEHSNDSLGPVKDEISIHQ
jgi:hypothetical protein